MKSVLVLESICFSLVWLRIIISWLWTKKKKLKNYNFYKISQKLKNFLNKKNIFMIVFTCIYKLFIKLLYCIIIFNFIFFIFIFYYFYVNSFSTISFKNLLFLIIFKFYLSLMKQNTIFTKINLIVMLF